MTLCECGELVPIFWRKQIPSGWEMEVECSSGTSVSPYRTARCHNPEAVNQTHLQSRVIRTETTTSLDFVMLSYNPQYYNDRRTNM